jgi:glycosyltransferase involved in cell wall biosynthesis
MRLLFCCEFYHPSRGGVQEVMRQIAERMVLAGHEITVATSYLPERNCARHNGVKIQDFKVAGNAVRGMVGEIDRYRNFVREFDGDAILIKAAQQWTFDALWPVLDIIKARKVFIPCGFSGLYEPVYQPYFSALPQVLAKFDHLIFYAERYRDIDFAHTNGLTRFTVLPNGASEVEFGVPADPGTRARLKISDDEFVFLTVGSPVANKGHRELAEAFALLDTGGRPATLILNGNWPPINANPPLLSREWLRLPTYLQLSQKLRARLQLGERFRVCLQLSMRLRAQLVNMFEPRLFRAQHAFRLLREQGWQGFMAGVKRRSRRVQLEKQRAANERADILLKNTLTTLQNRPNIVNDPPTIVKSPPTIMESIKHAEAQPGKRVLSTNFSRPDLVQAYLTADLFVFASNVEYSPLVLFEAAAAGTPFLSVPVGNAEEIARWTGGGIICPAAKDERGYTRVDPSVLAREMERCMGDPDMLARIGAAGKESWRQKFTWQVIAPQYEAILSGRTCGKGPQEPMMGEAVARGQ